MSDKPELGSVGWIDLTVDDAPRVRDFYREVVGWTASGLDMDGGYQDFVMSTPNTETATTGICHKRGPNAGLPSQWLIYVVVADVEQSAARCAELGGEVLRPAVEMGSHGRYCVIRDPAGACCALFQPA